MKKLRYDNLEIRIIRVDKSSRTSETRQTETDWPQYGDRYEIQLFQPSAGEVREEFSWPFAATDLENYLLKLAPTRQSVRKAYSLETEVTREFGGRLFEAAFKEKSRDYLLRRLENARMQANGLRLRLRLMDVPELMGLPWEYLCDRAHNEVFATSATTPLVRYLEMAQSVSPLQVESPLRILMMISTGQGESGLEGFTEQANLKAALADLERNGSVEIVTLPRPTLDALQEELDRGPFHVFHFIGHGDFDGQGYLLLEKDGRPFPVSGQNLGVMLRDYPLRLAVLNACLGAQTSPQNVFAGTAQSLIQIGLPAVVAMQFEITDKAAVRFATKFYRELASGSPVDVATSQSRRALYGDGGSEWGTPVIYLRSDDGHLFDIQPRTDAVVRDNAKTLQQESSNNASHLYDDRDAPPTTTKTPKEADDTAAKDPLAAHDDLEPTGGCVPIDSPFYVRRPVDAEFEKALRQRDGIILVYGARQMGKTSLLSRGREYALQQEIKTVYTDCQMLSAPQLATQDSLLQALAEMLVEELELDVAPQSHWNPQRSSKMNMTQFMKKIVLASQPTAILWLLDEVDRLLACDFADEVFSMFRSWYNERSMQSQSPWKRLMVAIGYATEASLFISDPHQSPFNVGRRIDLADFIETEVRELNTRYGDPLRSDAELERFYRLLGGQPFLVRSGLDAMTSRRLSVAELEQSANREDGVFSDHLQRLLNLLKRSGMTEAMRMVLHNGVCPTMESFLRLRAAGFVSGASMTDVRPRCLLYRNYLTRHLQ